MPRLDKRFAVVLFSGGQDSAIVLAKALTDFDRVETVGFDYGQRHAVELEARLAIRAGILAGFPRWAAKLGRDTRVDLSGLGAISETALTRATAIRDGDDGLPTTFVPGRNLLFLTLAAALAYQCGAGVLAAGMCEADFSGYPDCRKETLDAQMSAIALGMGASFDLETPLMHLSKAQSWFLAEELGGPELVELIREKSHSCYLGDRSRQHDWGYGCGGCPACGLRAKGWAAYVAAKSCRKDG
jgi:7-cyano-7-deazaguanine synthase